MTKDEFKAHMQAIKGALAAEFKGEKFDVVIIVSPHNADTMCCFTNVSDDGEVAALLGGAFDSLKQDPKSQAN
jgi:hypothetical protein